VDRRWRRVAACHRRNLGSDPWAAVRLQSWARYPAGNTDRACGAIAHTHPECAVKLAVVLFNLGGPDSPDAVEPFLKNLFSDPEILSLPGIVRLPLARLIAKRRAPVA